MITKWCFTLWFYNFIKQLCNRKQEDDTFLKKKKENQNKATMMIYVDGKATVFPVKLKLQGE